MNYLISRQAFVERLDLFLDLRKQVLQGRRFDPVEKQQYGALLDQSLPWSVSGYALSILSNFSETWRLYYFEKLTERFAEIIPLPGPSPYREFDQVRYLLRDVNVHCHKDLFQFLVSNNIDPIMLRKKSRSNSHITKALAELSGHFGSWPMVDSAIIQAYLVEIKQYITFNQTEEIKFKKLPPLPFTAQQLNSRANLVQLLRDSRYFFKHVKQVPPAIRTDEKKTWNTYIWNFKNNSNHVFSYFKTNDKFGVSKAIMDSLVFDIAEILGVESSFARTEISHDPFFDYEDKKGLKKPDIGTFQEALQGLALGDIVDAGDSDSLPMYKVSKAMLISLLFGFFDAHSLNIIVLREVA